MRVIVLGWGNDARGDDALGPLLARRIAARGCQGVEVLEDYQLQIEHALDLVGFEAALFVDASRDAPSPFSFRETEAGASPAPSTHALSPEAVLAVFARVTASAPPPAFVLGVRGERFGLGEGLSAAGAAALEAADRFCATLLGERRLNLWRRLAAERGARPDPACRVRLGAHRDGAP
jgi:hydrogenase maturation protease